MRAIKWSFDFSVGIEEIDQDHRRLITCLNDLFAACHAGQSASTLKDILEQLMQYTNEHFSHEEGVMRRIGYPAAKEHRDEHAQLVTELDDIIEKFDASDTHELNDETLQFLEDWLTHHIMIEDKKIGKFFGSI
jgi:hemerythrin